MTPSAPVLHAVAWFPPHHLGGTEVYLQGLVEALARDRRSSLVLTPRPGDALAPYRHGEVEVLPYPHREEVGQAAQADYIRRLLRAHPGAIYHQHSWTPDCGLDQFRLARAEGHRTVLTVHVPSLICMRGPSCGSAKPSAAAISPLNPALPAGRRAGGPHVRSPRPWPAGRRRPDPATRETHGDHGARAVSERQQPTGVFRSADAVVAVCQWLRDALAANGAPAEKLVLSRQGVGAPFDSLVPGPRRHGPGPRRLLFLGRWDEVKGVDIVVRAMVRQSDLPLRLSIHAVAGGPAAEQYRDRVEKIARGDARISIHPPADRGSLPKLMVDYDALVIPSVWLETGPLVALEAQAAGLFVIGSDLGGLAELIDEPQKGRLVRAGDVDAWARAPARVRRRRPAGGCLSAGPDHG